MGTVAEVIQGLGRASSPFVPRLMPLLMEAARDADLEVRSNAIFGLGVLAEHAREAVFEYPCSPLQGRGNGGPGNVGRKSGRWRNTKRLSDWLTDYLIG